MAILANPRAGKGPSLRLVQDFCRTLAGRGLEPALCWRLDELSQLLSDEWKQLRCIVAAGGDGTMLEVINRAPNLPVTALPVGNENLVARYCGLTKSADDVADVIAEGACSRVDVGTVNGKRFLLMASAGIDAEVVRHVHKQRRGHVNKLHYVASTLRVLASYRYPRFDVEIADTGERLRGAMVLVLNLPEYALNLSLAKQAQASDGRLDVHVFERSGLWNAARYAWSILRNRQSRLADYQYRLASRLLITADETVAVQTDGDPAGALPVELAVLPRALTIVVPRAVAEHAHLVKPK